MADIDYYQTLGVKKTASKDEISRAFRKLAKKYHPDRNPGDKEAEKRFKELSAAHEALSDPKKRKQYDQLREARARGYSTGDFSEFFQAAGQGRGRGPQGGGWSGGLGDFADLFSGLFGGGAAQAFGGAGGGPARRRGEDILQKIDIPFETAVSGGSVSIRLQRPETCRTCGGSGASPGSAPKPCPACGGRGTVQTSQGGFTVSRPCPTCFGRGRTIDRPCPTCAGTGSTARARKVSVKIPKGVKDGAKIRLTGEGQPGVAGGRAGDLYLQVHVKPHAGFERDGHDIYSTLELNIVQATLGTTVPVRTLNGTVDLRVPPATSSGAKLRLRGKGGPTPGGGHGDHYVRIKILAPKGLSTDQARLLRDFAHAAKLPT